MPKALCLFSLVASIFVVSIFLLDAAAGIVGIKPLQILGAASLMMDFTFVILGGILAYLSWVTYREQR